MKSYKPYLLALAATLLAVGSYFVAWSNIQVVKQKDAEERLTRLYLQPAVESKREASPSIYAAVKAPLSQNDLNQALQASALVKEDIFKQEPMWKRNARPVVLQEGKSYVAIVIDDVGVVPDRSERSVKELPAEVTLAFLPYGEWTPGLSALARELGHELMLHLPMQAKTSSTGKVANPGPNALYTHLHVNEIPVVVNSNLKELLPYIVGVNNHMGSKFTEWHDGLKSVLEVLEKSKLFFLDSITTPNSAAEKAMQDIHIPFLKRDVFIDHIAEKEDILKALRKVERVAKKQGHAIAIGHPHHETTDALKEWIKTLDDKNIQLVPITALIKENENER